MAKYPGAVNTGGYPSLEMQQYMLNQRTTAAIGNTLRSADILDSLTRTGTYLAETSPQQLLNDLLRNQSLLTTASWYNGVVARCKIAATRGGAFTDLDVRIITAYLRGYKVPSQ